METSVIVSSTINGFWPFGFHSHSKTSQGQNFTKDKRISFFMKVKKEDSLHLVTRLVGTNGVIEPSHVLTGWVKTLTQQCHSSCHRTLFWIRKNVVKGKNHVFDFVVVTVCVDPDDQWVSGERHAYKNLELKPPGGRIGTGGCTVSF
jgi:hypothetical protein